MSTERRAKSSNTLAAFAASGRTRFGVGPETPRSRPSGSELRKRIDALLDELDDDELHQLRTLEEGARLAIAWRLARAVAAAQGHVALDEGLGIAPELTWRAHTASYVQGPPDGPRWLAAIAKAEVGLVPTPETADTYADTSWTIARRLGVYGTRDGLLGLYSLLDSLEDAEVRWPSPEEIMSLEDALVLHALRLATESPGDDSADNETASVAKAERVLRVDYSLTESEVQSVMAMARSRALELLPSGEGARALQYASLEDGVRRAQAAMDLRSELSFRKLQAMVLGLTRSEPENQAAEFLSVVRRVSQQQDREQLASPVVESLPPAGKSENVDPVVLEREPDSDPDDDEAIVEFDRENSG